MKFNDTQKKWAMTGVLLAVLGFNISPYKSVRSFNVTDLAQTADPADMKVDEITQADGVYEAKYSKINEKQTLVEYRKILTESGAEVNCETCMEKFVLDKPFTTRLDILNMNLIKAMSAVEPKVEEVAATRGAKRVKAVKEESPDEEVVAQEDKKPARSKRQEKPDGAKVLALNIKNQCGDIKDKAEKVECVANETSDLFKDYDKYKIRKSDIVDLLNAQLLRPLSSQLSSIRSDNDMDYRSYAGQSKDLYNDLEEKISDALKPLNDLSLDIMSKDEGIATALEDKYSTLLEASLLAKDKAFKDGKNLEANIRFDDTKLTAKQIIEKQRFINEGMDKADQMSASLSQQLAASIYGGYAQSGTQSTDQYVIKDGAVYQRIDTVGRGNTAVGQSQLNTAGVVVPNNGQFNQNVALPSIITPNGTIQVQQQQPQMFGQTQQQVQYVSQPQQFVQQPQQVQYVQQPQMYSVPQNQYTVPQNQYSVSQNQGSVVNMGTFRTGGTSTTLSNGIQVVPRQ
jgi:hypothetical protein